MKTALVALFMAVGTLGLPSVAHSQQIQHHQSEAVIEIVTFRAALGVDPETLIERAEAVEDLLRSMPGFVERRLAQSADGEWIDIVVWTSLAHAQAAAASIGDHAVGQDFFEAIDPESVELKHAPIRSAADLLG